MVQWLGLSTLTAEAASSIPARGSKFPQVWESSVWPNTHPLSTPWCNISPQEREYLKGGLSLPLAGPLEILDQQWQGLSAPQVCKDLDQAEWGETQTCLGKHLPDGWN